MLKSALLYCLLMYDINVHPSKRQSPKMRSKVKDRLLYQLNDTYDVPYVLCTFAIYILLNGYKIAKAILHSGRYVRFNGNRKMNQLRGHVDTFTSIIALRKDENNDENEIG